jgi:hypothetical protein
MNRVLTGVAALAAALALAACGGGGDGSDSGSSTGGSSGGGDQFTTASLQKSLDAVKGKVGENAELLEVQITSAGTDFKVRSGEKASGFHFDPGSSDAQDVQVNVVGTGSLANSAFPISEVDPAAVDKMVAGAPQASGADDFKVTVMTFGKSFSPELQWTVNGEASGRTGLVLNAKPDGSGMSSPTGAVPGGASAGGSSTVGGAATTPGAAGAANGQAIADCIKNAGGDTAKIQACVNQ